MTALLAFFWFWYQAPLPVDPSALFYAGNRQYIEEDFTGAIVTWEAIITAGHEDGTVYFNLGNAYYKLENPARAILNYRRAMRLLPNDPDLQANLQLAQLQIVDKITPIPQVFYRRVWGGLVQMYDEPTWQWFLLSALNLTALLWCVRILQGRWPRGVRALTMTAAVCSLLLLGCTFSASTARHSHDAAVITAQKVEVRGSPSDDGVELFALHEGAEVRIRRESGAWYEILLADGKVGWVLRAALEII